VDARPLTRLALVAAVALPACAEAPADPPPPEQPLPKVVQRYVGELRHGQTIGRLTFPSFHKTVRVRAGFRQKDVDRGPSWFPGSWLPGEGGTIYIAAHRRTHGGPFREIGDLRRGDRVIFTTPYAVATYSVERHALISERRVSILTSGNREQLRLQASTIPAGHKRLIVFAGLEEIERR
jgi:LPXTG-site transpeptidase (sortase) family protein